MSKTQKTTNTPGWSAPPPTQASTALQGMVGEGTDYATPLRNQYARAKEENSRSYNDPLGSFTTADTRDKSKRATNASFDQNLGMDLADAALQSQQAKFGQQSQVAGHTAPQMYNATSVNKQSDPWGTGMQIARIGTSAGLGASGK